MAGCTARRPCAQHLAGIRPVPRTGRGAKAPANMTSMTRSMALAIRGLAQEPKRVQPPHDQAGVGGGDATETVEQGPAHAWRHIAHHAEVEEDQALPPGPGWTSRLPGCGSAWKKPTSSTCLK